MPRPASARVRPRTHRAAASHHGPSRSARLRGRARPRQASTCHKRHSYPRHPASDQRASPSWQLPPHRHASDAGRRRSRVRGQVRNGGKMKSGRGACLRQMHAAELAGADKSDAQGLAGPRPRAVGALHADSPVVLPEPAPCARRRKRHATRTGRGTARDNAPWQPSAKGRCPPPTPARTAEIPRGRVGQPRTAVLSKPTRTLPQ